MDRAGRVIYLGTFSKSIASSIRVSYMVLPMHLLEVYEERCGFYACAVPNVMQQTIYQFMRDGYFEKNLNRMRGIYKAKHDFLLGELKKCGWVKKIMGGNAGLHLLVEVDSTHPEAEIIEKCKRAGVRIYGLSEYFIQRKSTFERPVFLLGYGGLSNEEILTGLKKIEICLNVSSLQKIE
jgi:GntR family transcriptional regulator/MocR family aminotransferase